MPCGETFLEHGTMICGVHLTSGQREMLPDRLISVTPLLRSLACEHCM
ncbi:hypothetical protein QFZ91_005520 [Paraburkholderia sp. JPY419]